MLNILSCIGFISDKYRMSKKISLKMGNTALLISSSIYAKRQKMCAQEALCVPRF